MKFWAAILLVTLVTTTSGDDSLENDSFEMDSDEIVIASINPVPAVSYSSGFVDSSPGIYTAFYPYDPLVDSFDDYGEPLPMEYSSLSRNRLRQPVRSAGTNRYTPQKHRRVNRPTSTFSQAQNQHTLNLKRQQLREKLLHRQQQQLIKQQLQLKQQQLDYQHQLSNLRKQQQVPFLNQQSSQYVPATHGQQQFTQAGQAQQLVPASQSGVVSTQTNVSPIPNHFIITAQAPGNVVPVSQAGSGSNLVPAGIPVQGVPVQTTSGQGVVIQGIAVQAVPVTGIVPSQGQYFASQQPSTGFVQQPQQNYNPLHQQQPGFVQRQNYNPTHPHNQQNLIQFPQQQAGLSQHHTQQNYYQFKQQTGYVQPQNQNQQQTGFNQQQYTPNQQQQTGFNQQRQTGFNQQQYNPNQQQQTEFSQQQYNPNQQQQTGFSQQQYTPNQHQTGYQNQQQTGYQNQQQTGYQNQPHQGSNPNFYSGADDNAVDTENEDGLVNDYLL